MRNLIMGLIIGFIVGSTLTIQASNISTNAIWNKLFDSSNNTLKIITK